MKIKIIIFSIIASIFFIGCNLGGDSQEVAVDEIVANMTHPDVKSAQPASQEKGVGSVPNIIITFVKDVNGASANSAIVLRDASGTALTTNKIVSGAQVILDLNGLVLNYGSQYSINIDTSLGFTDGTQVEYAYKSYFTTAKVTLLNTLMGTKISETDINSFAMSGDGNSVIVTSYLSPDGRIVKLDRSNSGWNLTFNTIYGYLPNYGKSVQMNYDGTMYLVTSSYASEQLNIYKNNVRVPMGLIADSVSMSNDGLYLVSNDTLTAGNYQALTYDGLKFGSAVNFTPTTRGLSCLSPDGAIAASVSDDGLIINIHKFNLPTTPYGSITLLNMANGIDLNSDGNVLLATSYDSMNIYRDENNNGTYVLKGTKALPYSASSKIGKISSDGTTIWVSDTDFNSFTGRLFKYNFDLATNTMTLHSIYTNPSNTISDVFGAKLDISDDGTRVIVAAMPAAGIKKVYIIE